MTSTFLLLGGNMYFAYGLQLAVIWYLVSNGFKYTNRLKTNAKRQYVYAALLEKQPQSITLNILLGLFIQIVFLIPYIKTIHHNAEFFSTVSGFLFIVVVVAYLLRIKSTQKLNKTMEKVILNYTRATLVMYSTLLLYFSLPVIYLTLQLIRTV